MVCVRVFCANQVKCVCDVRIDGFVWQSMSGAWLQDESFFINVDSGHSICK